MAIKSSLSEINQIQKKVQKRENMQDFVSETLLGLSQTLNNKLVVDPIMANQIINIADGLDVSQQINDLQTLLTDNRQKLRSSGAQKKIVDLDYKTATLNNTISTLKNIQNEKITQQRILTQEEAARANLKAPQGGNRNNNNNNNNNPNTDWQNYNTQLTTINTNISDCNDHILECDRAIALLEQIQSLQELETYYGNIIKNRKGELTGIKNIIDSFNQGTTLSPLTHQVGQNPNTTVDLNSSFLNGTANIDYTFCDNSSGEPISLDKNNLQISQNGKTISLKGISIVNNQMKLQSIGIDPIEDITFPLRVTLAVRGRILDTKTGIFLDHYKPIDITINQPQLGLPEREQAYNNLNVGGTIDTRIDIEHKNNSQTREDDVLREMLSAGGNKEEIETLRKDAAQAKQFMQRIRELPNLIPVVSVAQAINQAQGGFRTEMTDLARKVPVQHLVNQNAFADYLRHNIDGNIKDYLKKKIRTTLDNSQNRDLILREFLDFQTELKNNKIDSNADQDTHADLNGVTMESKRRFTFFGRNDNNYMKFFSGMSSVDLGEQTVNLNKPITYTMKLDVSTKNHISTTIKIGDKKERTYKAGNPMTLMQNILSNTDISEGKTRMHIAYNIAKGMIQKAKEEDISLTYRDANGHNMIIKMEDKNIILEDQDDLTNHGGSNRRITQTLFDYSLFESTNSWENTNRSGPKVPQPDNRSLRVGIDRLTKHFNLAMNQLNANYSGATERKFGGLFTSKTSVNFPSSAWTSPIKKLLNCRTTTNFDFTTNVSHNGKSVQIERQKNTFILTIDDIVLKGKILGKLLNKRKKGIRIFDGIERDICGEVYKNMVEKLRTNSKIARSNFGVMDPATGRMYILDEDGQLGYIRAESASKEKDNLNRKVGVNTIATGVLAGGLTAAGIATGGAAALAAGLSWSAAGTATSRTGAAIAGTSFGKDVLGIMGRGYGTLADAPAARVICDESETREVFKNPLLMGKFMKAMNLRLGQF